MNTEAQVTFRGMATSPAAEKQIREKIAHLEHYAPDISGCRVVLERQSSRHRKGNLFHVSIDLKVPGNEIVINHEAKGAPEHEDAYVAIHDAFDAAKRRLEDYERKRRGDKRTHRSEPIPAAAPDVAEPVASIRPGMTAMDAIDKRRAVRSFLSDPLDEPTIQTLLTAAVRAPTAVHEEPWCFVVVQDRALMKSISDESKRLFLKAMGKEPTQGHSFETFAREDFNLFYDAGTLIVVCSKPMGQFVAADCWLAAENLMLAACAMGFGTCVIGSAVAGINTAKTKKQLGIPEGVTAVAPIIVGVPNGAPRATPRKKPEILSWN